MPVSTDDDAETTETPLAGGVLDDALRSLRIAGSVLLREVYAPPWSVAIPDHERLSALLGAGPETRVVAFHLVEFGHCAVQVNGGDQVLLTAGEMAICFGGKSHRLGQGAKAHTVPLETLLAGHKSPRRMEQAGQSAATSLLCGAFFLHHTNFNPLYAALPAILRVSLSRPGQLHNLYGVAKLMAEELDRGSMATAYVVERLLEVLLAEAVRAHLESVPQQETSWFRGIKDPIVGRAIASIHSRPGEPWSVQRLAEDVAMSPSRFAARFVETVGDSPMAYVSKWRMNVACRQLKTTRERVEQIAANAGYESQAAFSRAFRKYLGASPAEWRAANSANT